MEEEQLNKTLSEMDQEQLDKKLIEEKSNLKKRCMLCKGLSNYCPACFRLFLSFGEEEDKIREKFKKIKKEKNGK